MSCRIITSPITGKEETSQTWNDIRALVATEEEADKLYNQLRSDEFKAWFGDWTRPNRGDVSKVVNAIGEPLVVYHGTDNENIEIFDSNKLKRNELGIYFTPDLRYADYYRSQKIIPNDGIFSVNGFNYKKISIGNDNYFLKKDTNLPSERLKPNQAVEKYKISEEEFNAAKNIYDKSGKVYPAFLNIKELEIVEDGYFGLSSDTSDTGGMLTNDEGGNMNIYAVKTSNQIKSVFNEGSFAIDKGGYDNTKSGSVVTENTVAAKVAKMKELESKGAFRVKPIDGGVSFYYDPNNINFQTAEMPLTQASPETISKVKQILEKMGVTIKDLATYAREAGLNSTGINAVADVVSKVIAIAEGKENVALTEEMVHIATAILEQKNPQLVTQMISKIDRFAIYQQTLDQYKNNPNYQLPNGKPNIRKIKKEAVDKLIAELIVYNNEGTTEFPELMDETNRSIIRNFFEKILDWFRGMYKSANIDIFQEAAAIIEEGVEGDVIDTGADQIYYQLNLLPTI